MNCVRRIGKLPRLHARVSTALSMRTRYVAFTVVLLLIGAPPLQAQDHITFSGSSFGDYYYVMDSPAESEEDFNGFTIRRIYLATDFRLSGAFDGRARLEASDGSATGAGMQAFAKDLYLRWRGETGHQARIGIIPTPVFGFTEDVWTFRSLEKTAMDLYGVASSRDMGVRVDGPLLPDGILGYHLMFANNSGVRPENDKGKRGYVQLSSQPSDALVFTIGGDYAGFTDQRERHVTAHALGGYRSPAFAFGIEPFWQRVRFEGNVHSTTSGLSLFAHGTITGPWQLVGRIDRIRLESVLDDVSHSTFGLVAISYQAVSNVRLMPNLLIHKLDGEEAATVLARFTFEFWF